MVELSLERIDEMLHKETLKKEETTTILRCVFSRYMQLYERYLADIDALNDEMIAELKAYHEETRSLCRYYYMDIPLEICSDLYDYDEEYTKKLLGPDWKKYISDSFEEFKTENKGKIKPEEMKAEFQDQNLNAFYLSMDEIFRDVSRWTRYSGTLSAQEARPQRKRQAGFPDFCSGKKIKGRGSFLCSTRKTKRLPAGITTSRWR